MAKAATKKGSPAKKAVAVKSKQPPKIAKPASPDDLKKISGVGPKLSGVLNGLSLFRRRWTLKQFGRIIRMVCLR